MWQSFGKPMKMMVMEALVALHAQKQCDRALRCTDADGGCSRTSLSRIPIPTPLPTMKTILQTFETRLNFWSPRIPLNRFASLAFHCPHNSNIQTRLSQYLSLVHHSEFISRIAPRKMIRDCACRSVVRHLKALQWS